MVRAAAVMMAIGLLSGCSPKSAEEIAADRLEQEDDQMIIGARVRLEGGLRDPDSVRYGAVQVSRKAGIPIVCGHYNAKNGFGGYAGEAPFMATNDVIIEPSQVGEDAFVKLWEGSC